MMANPSISIAILSALVLGLASPAGAAPPVTVPAKGGLPACQATLNACNTNLRDCDAELSTCKDDLANALKSTLPATGQTKCWDTSGNSINCSGTGQDGDIQAGAPLSYTDNGDGTITDNNTQFVWEKKDDSGGIHDKDNTYTWNDAFAFIAALNNTSVPFHKFCKKF
jgi:hypothetical protein